MIIPRLEKGPFYCPDAKDKWFLFYWETVDGENYARYLHPKGWKRHSYYFDAPDEAEKVFQKYNQAPVPVEEWEIERRRADIEYYREMREQEFHEMMEEFFKKEFADQE